MDTVYRDAVRLQTSVLSGAEKALLIRIAERLPRWVSSDLLTVVGALGMAMAGLSYWLAARDPGWLVMVVVVAGHQLVWRQSRRHGGRAFGISNGRGTASTSIMCSTRSARSFCWRVSGCPAT